MTWGSIRPVPMRRPPTAAAPTLPTGGGWSGEDTPSCGGRLRGRGAWGWGCTPQVCRRDGPPVDVTLGHKDASAWGSIHMGAPRTLCGQPVPPGADGGAVVPLDGRTSAAPSLNSPVPQFPLYAGGSRSSSLCAPSVPSSPSPPTRPGHTSSGHSPWNVQQPHGGPSDPPEALNGEALGHSPWVPIWPRPLVSWTQGRFSTL